MDAERYIRMNIPLPVDEHEVATRRAKEEKLPMTRYVRRLIAADARRVAEKGR